MPPILPIASPGRPAGGIGLAHDARSQSRTSCVCFCFVARLLRKTGSAFPRRALRAERPRIASATKTGPAARAQNSRRRLRPSPATVVLPAGA